MNPSTGVPYQLGFGWTASTGSADDNNEISNVVVSTLQPVPSLTAAISDSDTRGGRSWHGQLHGHGRGRHGEQRSDPISMTTTLPSGVTPGTAAGTGWSCATAGEVVTCTYAASVPAGTTLPPVTLPATVAKAPPPRPVLSGPR